MVWGSTTDESQDLAGIVIYGQNKKVNIGKATILFVYAD